MIEQKRIAIIGGTGKEGKGLAYRWAKAGYEVCIGSRKLEKAQEAIKEIVSMQKNGQSFILHSAENEDAAKWGEIVVLTIPYAHHEEMLQTLKSNLNGKIFVDVTVPLVPPKVSVIQIPEEGSVGLKAQKILGEGVKIISAFQNISFELLLKDEPIECDVPLCGSDKKAREIGMQLVEDAGLDVWDAGPLENAIIAEGLTSILIRINKQYQTHSAGIKITGIEK
jgi:8-hydroxy-5-deazaflavin:NADPH oxidoreductase